MKKNCDYSIEDFKDRDLYIIYHVDDVDGNMSAGVLGNHFNVKDENIKPMSNGVDFKMHEGYVTWQNQSYSFFESINITNKTTIIFTDITFPDFIEKCNVLEKHGVQILINDHHQIVLDNREWMLERALFDWSELTEDEFRSMSATGYCYFGLSYYCLDAYANTWNALHCISACDTGNKPDILRMNGNDNYLEVNNAVYTRANHELNIVGRLNPRKFATNLLKMHGFNMIVKEGEMLLAQVKGMAKQRASRAKLLRNLRIFTEENRRLEFDKRALVIEDNYPVGYKNVIDALKEENKYKNIDFVIFMVKDSFKLEIKFTLVAWDNFDTTQITIPCGGGGHKGASGFKIDSRRVYSSSTMIIDEEVYMLTIDAFK